MFLPLPWYFTFLSASMTDVEDGDTGPEPTSTFAACSCGVGCGNGVGAEVTEPCAAAAWSAPPAEPLAPRPTPGGKDVPCGVHAPSVAAVRKRWKIAEVPDWSPR